VKVEAIDKVKNNSDKRLCLQELAMNQLVSPILLLVKKLNFH